MNFSGFKGLFSKALNVAAQTAEDRLDRTLVRNFLIDLQGGVQEGRLIDESAAAEAIFINDNEFWVIVDIMVTSVSGDSCTVFVRCSGHAPVSFAETWDPSALGPFKIIESSEIKTL